MVIIYNEELALKDVKLFHAKKRKRRLTGIIATIIALVGVIFYVIAMLTNSDVAVWCGCIGFGLILTAMPVTLIMDNADYQPVPSIAAKYYIATEDKKVQGVRVETRLGAGNTYEAVCLLIESEDGSIESTVLCPAEYQENTKVQEQIFDVNKGIVFVPYKKEHSKNNAEEKPLTIKELQQMEGNIVFLIPLNDWAKVMHYGLVYFGTETNSLWQDIVGDYGKKWLAYAQKPREREREELTNLLLRKDDRQ